MNQQLLEKYNIDLTGDLYAVAKKLENAKVRILQRLNSVTADTDIERMLDEELCGVEEALQEVTNKVLSFDDVELKDRGLKLTDVSSVAEDQEKGDALFEKLSAIYSNGLGDLTLEQLKVLSDEAFRLNHEYSVFTTLLMGSIRFDSVLYMRTLAERFRKGFDFLGAPDYEEAEYWDRRADYFEHYAENRIICEEYRLYERFETWLPSNIDASRLLREYIPSEAADEPDVPSAVGLGCRYPASLNITALLMGVHPEYDICGADFDEFSRMTIASLFEDGGERCEALMAEYSREAFLGLTIRIFSPLTEGGYESLRDRLSAIIGPAEKTIRTDEKEHIDRKNLALMLLFQAKVYIGTATADDAMEFLSLNLGEVFGIRLAQTLELFRDLNDYLGEYRCIGALYLLLHFLFGTKRDVLNLDEQEYENLGAVAYSCMMGFSKANQAAGGKQEYMVRLYEAYINSYFPGKNGRAVASILSLLFSTYGGDILGYEDAGEVLDVDRDKAIRYARWYLALPEEFRNEDMTDDAEYLLRETT